ncbi:uncharacterized protein LOC133720795 [Rosa rugosa]|uniref:uncharacterized protein LOC133720795 n=1 Tax=Rosa rugosa TaxID=74645 RepID=UPI002B404BC7|nr:uncharacterized protein LOC133720795 [Rosa rugosa]XP_062003252.1 uncharacterized protein LOC133720795 [Rosa rugosa]XP_062003253.1 uncharacterized protein LOC133720795 [Rosa rugosa]XP_062003254.1 uncharacterized protein LOC133720795 [Rosa rugosa]XP_062003255.1 uncharacterized protein LOC133720795 [Rosa rugosa]
MGSVLELKNSSKQQNKITAEDTIVHPQANRRTKHQEKVKVRAGVGSAGNDAHHKARQDGTDSVLVQEKSLGNLNRQSRKEKAAKVDELVRHMSNLPGYLQHPERGEKLPEKVLNFGVLDWSRLEKWKHKQKHSPGKGSHNTPLENIAAASISSGLVRPASRPDQQSPRCSSLKSSQKDVLAQGVKPSAQSVVRFQDCETPSKNGINGQKKIPFPNRSFGRNHSDIMLDKGKGKSSAQRISSVREAAPGSKSYGVSFGQKEDLSSCDSQAKKTKELQESDIKRKNIDETIISETGSHSSKSQSYDVLLSSKGKTIACDDKTEKSVEELPKLDRNLAHQPCPVEENNIVLLPPKAFPQSSSPKVLQLSKPRASCDVHLAEANKISFSGDFSTSEMDFEEQYSEVPHSCPLPSAGKRLTSSSFDISKTLDQEDVELSTRKGRHPSPNRRFSFSLGRLGRSFSFKENAAVPESSSTYMTVKSGPVRPETSDCSDNPKGEKTSSHNRARSSPLRRLLDPILKHKGANPLHSAEAVKAMKANLNTFVPRSINVSESLQKEKREASSVQALLQLTMKNGLPLFKFLVDRSSNCFVATMKNSSEKDDFGQNFTFYCVNEIKRKVGWMSQGSKSKSCGYAYNVVGQMKVSTSDLSDVNGQNFCKHIIRESVLFGMELRQQANQEAPQFMLNRELAAAVVTIPSKDLSNEETMEKGSTKCSPEHGLSCNWEDSSIVILPGGVHSSPNKGEPSPLIARWKSGGSCDCGGWDVGCKLRVLSNQNKCRQNSKTTTASPSSDHFELFAEGEAQENRAVFRLEPGKDGTYSIEFNTSISLLQALFICVVIFSSQKPSDMSEAKVSQEATLNGNSGIQVTTPSKYAQNPPHSPVGRV